MFASTTVLEKIEAENEREPSWIVGPETGKILHGLVRVWQPKVILEIGTSVGYSAIWMASALRENGGGKLWTIESHVQRYEKALLNIEAAGLSELVVNLKGHAPEIFSDDSGIPGEIDMAFFDATKKEHKQFFDAVYPRMRPGGLIVVDNVQSHRFGEMKKFIDFMHGASFLQVVELPVGAGLLLARIR